MRILNHLIYILLIGFSIIASAAGPFCPSAPANCSFSYVEKGLKELKEDRFFGLLKSPDSACKGSLMQGVKAENVMPELMADPRFTSYVTPQIMQCWKDGGASNAKLETLARYAYIQRRFDENADNLLDYQVFADSVLGNEPLSNVSDCKKEAPELAGFVTKCQELKASCKKSDMAQTLAQSFIDDYKSQDIKNIEAQFKAAQKTWNGCSPRQRSGKTCADAKAESAKLAFRLQVFYANYPWAQDDKFREMTEKRGYDDVNLVTQALKAQVTENKNHVTKQLKELTTASQCLLRNNCDSDKVNDVLERTRPLADQYLFNKGDSRATLNNKAAITQFVSYNNCLDDLGEAQRKTSTTLWTSGIGAVGAVVTMGGSLVLTGLTAGGRAVMGAAAIGSRVASVGKMALSLGQAVDGLSAAHSVAEASGHCGKKSTGYLKPASEKSTAPVACGIPTAGQMEFKKEYDGCVLDMVLGAAGGAGLLVGLKNANKAKQLAAEAQEAKTATTVGRTSTPPPPPPKANVANTAETVAEQPGVQAAAATVTAEKAAAATANAENAAGKAAVSAEQTANQASNAAGKGTSSAPKTTDPLASTGTSGNSTSSSSSSSSKLVTEGDYISVQTGGVRQPSVVLQTQEKAGMKMYQIATQAADGTVTKKWISQKNLASMKPKASDASKEILGASNLNKEFAQSAIQNINRGSPPETVRAMVGKLNDKYDGGEARLKIAAKILGRDSASALTDAEKKWIMSGHNTHADTGYGKIGSQKVRDKLKSGDGRPSSISTADTRRLMEYGAMGTENGSSVARKVDVPGSTLNGRETAVLNSPAGDVHITFTGSRVEGGEIIHEFQYTHGGVTYAKQGRESQLLGLMKAEPTESAAARAAAKADDIPTPPKPAVEAQAPTPTPKPVVETPAPPSATPARTPAQMQQHARPLNPTAANDIEALNQSQMRTVVNRNKPEVLNGKSVGKPERMREQYGNELGISDANRRAAIDYAPIANNKTMTSAMQKALGAESKVDVTQLRQMMSFNPAGGYVTPNQFANAARFVEEVNAKGGVKALDKLPLSPSEREVLNAIMERAPSYASYADPKVRPLGQLKIRKSPVEATHPDRDVVFTDSQGRTLQGKETIRQVGADGENISSVRVTNADGTTSTHSMRTSQTMDAAEAQRLQNFDRGITERANANRAAHVAKTEEAGYVNPHGVPKAELQASTYAPREVKVKIRTLDGIKDTEAVIEGKPFKGVNGTQEIQVKYYDGVENGKAVYKYATVSIDEIEHVKPVVAKVVPVAEATPFKPIAEGVRRPAEKAMDAASDYGKTFRKSVDQEAADILTDRRVGGQAHISDLRQAHHDDYVLMQQTQLKDRNAMYVSQQGMKSDPRFDPRTFYAHQSNEYHAAKAAPKGSEAANRLGQLEQNYLGTIRYNDTGSYRAGSARETALAVAKQQGKSPEEIAKLEKWMDDFDQAAPRLRNVERAEAAQKVFDGLRTTLQKALANDSSTPPITQSTFESMAKSLNDMMLPPEKKQAAEAALKKLRCSRPEWKIQDGQFKNFNLKCD